MTLRDRLERNQHIAAMYRGGMSLRDVGYEFFLTAQGVAGILKTEGVSLRNKSAARYLLFRNRRAGAR